MDENGCSWTKSIVCVLTAANEVMAFRPFARYFGEQSFAQWAAGKDKEDATRVQSHRDLPSLRLREDSPNHLLWYQQLHSMRTKVRRQRSKIAYRDEAFQATLHKEQQLRDLRLLMKRRHQKSQADYYRQLVHCTPSHPGSPSTHPFSAVFLTDLGDAEVCLRRNPTPTPVLDTSTSPLRRPRLKPRPHLLPH